MIMSHHKYSILSSMQAAQNLTPAVNSWILNVGIRGDKCVFIKGWESNLTQQEKLIFLEQ